MSDTCCIMVPTTWYMVNCGAPGKRLDPRDNNWLCAKHEHFADKPLPDPNAPWKTPRARAEGTARPVKRRPIKLTPKAEAVRARFGVTGIGIDGDGI